MAEKKIISNIPEPNWLKEVASNSCLNVKDITQIFNIKLTTLDNLIRRGEFPEPDKRTVRNKRQWRTAIIKKYFKENKENGNSR